MIADRLSRRRFLAFGLAFVVVGTTGAACGPDPAASLPETAQRLRAFLTDAEGAARLGGVVNRPGLGAMPSSVIAPPGNDPLLWLKTIDDAGFAARVRGAVAADLGGFRFIEVAGWILTRTEAAICALAADALQV